MLRNQITPWENLQPTTLQDIQEQCNKVQLPKNCHENSRIKFVQKQSKNNKYTTLQNITKKIYSDQNQNHFKQMLSQDFTNQTKISTDYRNKSKYKTIIKFDRKLTGSMQQFKYKQNQIIKQNKPVLIAVFNSKTPKQVRITNFMQNIQNERIFVPNKLKGRHKKDSLILPKVRIISKQNDLGLVFRHL